MRTQRVRTRKRMTVEKMYPLYIRQISFKEIYVKLTCLCQIIRFYALCKTLNMTVKNMNDVLIIEQLLSDGNYRCSK